MHGIYIILYILYILYIYIYIYILMIQIHIHPHISYINISASLWPCMHTSEVPRMYHKEVQPSTAELRRTIIIHGSNFEQSKKVQWPSRCRFKISTYGFPTQRNRTPNFDSKNIEDIIVGGVVWMSNFWWLQPHLQFYNDLFLIYSPVMKHDNGKSPAL